MATSLPLPERLPLEAEQWEQFPPAAQALIVQLWGMIQAQQKRIEELEARVGQQSHNSDRPPSSDPPWERPRTLQKRTSGKPGAHRGHPGHCQALLTPTEVIDVLPPRCLCGQEELINPAPYYTHQVFELPEIEMEVRHVVLHQAQCPHCGRITKAQLSSEVASGYGPRLSALIGELSSAQRGSRSVVQEFCASVLRIPISRGAIQRVVDRVSEAISPHYERIAEVARAAHVNHVDETTWYRHGVLAWLWVMVNTTVAFFHVQASRSKAAFEKLVGHWAGILVSDGYGAYQSWVHGRQACLAHLIRRARGLSERKDAEVARFGRRIRDELQRMVHWAKAPPTRGEVQAWYARVSSLLSSHWERGDEAGKFARTLDREMEHLWVFLVEEGVDPTNNRAERSLRFAVLWRKMMQGTSSDKGDRWVERILSLRETCRLRSMPTFPILVDAMTCYVNDQEPDLSWI